MKLNSFQKTDTKKPVSVSIEKMFTIRDLEHCTEFIINSCSIVFVPKKYTWAIHIHPSTDRKGLPYILMGVSPEEGDKINQRLHNPGKHDYRPTGGLEIDVFADWETRETSNPITVRNQLIFKRDQTALRAVRDAMSFYIEFAQKDCGSDKQLANQRTNILLFCANELRLPSDHFLIRPFKMTFAHLHDMLLFVKYPRAQEITPTSMDDTELWADILAHERERRKSIGRKRTRSFTITASRKGVCFELGTLPVDGFLPVDGSTAEKKIRKTTGSPQRDLIVGKNKYIDIPADDKEPMPPPRPQQQHRVVDVVYPQRITHTSDQPSPSPSRVSIDAAPRERNAFVFPEQRKNPNAPFDDFLKKEVDLYGSDCDEKM